VGRHQTIKSNLPSAMPPVTLYLSQRVASCLFVAACGVLSAPCLGQALAPAPDLLPVSPARRANQQLISADIGPS